MMTEFSGFTQRVMEIIREIPAGKVMTYGQIAKHAGSPRGARQVVRILHSMSTKHHLPWHRVINVKGEIALPDEEHFMTQKLSLEMEGVVVSEDGRICLEKFLHHPGV